MTPVALITGRSEYDSECLQPVLDITRQVIQRGFDLFFAKLASRNIGAQLLQRSARGFERRCATFALRERFQLRIAQQFVNRRQQAKEVALFNAMEGPRERPSYQDLRLSSFFCTASHSKSHNFYRFSTVSPELDLAND